MTGGVRGELVQLPSGPAADEMRDRFVKDGPCHEYQEFEASISAATFQPARGSQPNIWDFIQDAVTGEGGFRDGNYLVRFQREQSRKKSGDTRFLERIATTRYDNFARRISDAPWTRIVTRKDQISRKTEDPRVDAFWASADMRRTPLLGVIDFVARQARWYGTGWLVVDRPAAPLRNRASDQDPRLAPYAYCVPTRNVVDWEFDDDYRLVGVTFLEPRGRQQSFDQRDCNLRVWTTSEWAVYEPIGAKKYERLEGAAGGGPNAIGEVPVVQMFDGSPGPGCGFGLAIMPSIALIARDVYNKTSEKRSLMRKCAAFLGIPVKDLEQWLKKKTEIGEDVAVPFDASAGPPAWISPDLDSLVKFAQDIKDDKEAAFESARLSAISGYLQTSSGFHQEAIFSETNTEIATFANQCEATETGATRLTLRYHGEKDEAKIRTLFSISYPTDFGIVDKDAAIARAEKRLGMDLGVADAEEVIFAMYVAEDPREDRKQLRERAQVAAQAHYQQLAADQAAAAEMQRQNALTARARLGVAQKGVPPGAPQTAPPAAAQGQGGQTAPPADKTKAAAA